MVLSSAITVHFDVEGQERDLLFNLTICHTLIFGENSLWLSTSCSHRSHLKPLTQKVRMAETMDVILSTVALAGTVDFHIGSAEFG